MKKTFFQRIGGLSLRAKLFSGLAAIVVIGGISYGIFGGKAAPVELLKVTRGTVTEEVQVTGTTKPAEEVSLAFERSGRIAKVTKEVGDHVVAGETIAQLEQSELSAQLEQAQGALAAAQAKLSELNRGARPEDIQVTQTQITKAEQDLSNYYESVSDVLESAYNDADTAIRKNIDALFSDDEGVNVALTFPTTNSQKEIEAISGRSKASLSLKKWQSELASISASSDDASLDTAMTGDTAYLIALRSFLGTVMDVTLVATSIPTSTINTYITSVTTARTTVNSAISSLNSQMQTIASQKVTVQQLKDQLALKLAGTDPEQIKAQAAAVAQAQANVSLVYAQLNKTRLVSPITGVVTKQDAKTGEIVGANTPLVGIISQQNLEIEANIPEVDIGRVAIGNVVRITLDAFPGVTMMGKVIHIDPGETVVDGVVNFKVKVAFDDATENNGAVGSVKSGLTANLSIETQSKENVLMLPQFALTERDNGTFVQKSANGTVTEVLVTTGLRGADGMTEITAGVSEGDEVLNVAAK
jgi:HlyD family secretion protein